MKKVTAIMLIFVLMFAATSFAQDTTGENTAMTKLGRGFLNILDAVTEIPGTMMRKSSTDGVGTGLTVGLLEGVVNTVKRAVVGVYEVASFPIPVPADYEPILDDPQFLTVE